LLLSLFSQRELTTVLVTHPRWVALMPEHVQLLVGEPLVSSLSVALQVLKQKTSGKLKSQSDAWRRPGRCGAGRREDDLLHTWEPVTGAGLRGRCRTPPAALRGGCPRRDARPAMHKRSMFSERIGFPGGGPPYTSPGNSVPHFGAFFPDARLGNHKPHPRSEASHQPSTVLFNCPHAA
jgi:hypothetical protein